MTKDHSPAFPEVFHNIRFWGCLFNSRCNLTCSDIYSFSTQTTVEKYLQKSNFRQEEKESHQNGNFHHSICLPRDFKYEKGTATQRSLTLPYSAWESSQNLDLVRNPKYGYEIQSARTDCSCELSLMLLPLFRSCLPRLITHTGIIKARRRAVWLLAVLSRLNSIRCCSLMCTRLPFTHFDVWVVICGSHFTCVKINTKLCMLPTAALM